MDNRTKKKYRYMEVYEDLTARIGEGEYPLDGLIPSEKELGRIYSVERTTVRKALELLVNDGLVVKQQGIGARVVSREKVARDSSQASSSDTILFFLPRTSNDLDRLSQAYYSQMFFHLEQELKDKGYKTIYSTIGGNDDIEDLLKQHSYAGIIFASYGVDKRHLDYVNKHNIPFITVNNDYSNGVFITPDNYMGGYLIGRHLAELGHRKIAVLKGRDEDASCSLRFAGLKIALDEKNIRLDERLVRSSNWTAEDALLITRELLKENRENLPSALFAFNDEMALSAIRVINEMGLKVPDDISVAGFDNISQSQYFSPPLTTINCNVEMISRTAVWMLHNKIQNDELDNFKITIPVELMKRGSTGQAPD